MMRKWTCLLALAGGCLLVLSASSEAQKEKKAEPAKEKKVEPTKEEIQRERMRQLMMAYDLAHQGRKKNAPEYVITAAAILRQLSSIKDLQEMKKLNVKPKITGGDGKPGLDKEYKALSPLEQSDALFKEASDMGAALNINVDKLIKLAKERETTDKEERDFGKFGKVPATGLWRYDGVIPGRKGPLFPAPKYTFVNDSMNPLSVRPFSPYPYYQSWNFAYVVSPGINNPLNVTIKYFMNDNMMGPVATVFSGPTNGYPNPPSQPWRKNLSLEITNNYPTPAAFAIFIVPPYWAATQLVSSPVNNSAINQTTALTPFNLVIYAKNGKGDTDINFPVLPPAILTILPDRSTLTGPLIAQFDNGKASFNGLQFTKAGTYVVRVSVLAPPGGSSSLPPIDVKIIAVPSNAVK